MVFPGVVMARSMLIYGWPVKRRGEAGMRGVITQRHVAAEADTAHFETHTFVQVVAGSTFVVRRGDMPRPDQPLTSPGMRAVIAAAVELLADRVHADGWEPLIFGIDDLWRAGSVTMRHRRVGLLGRAWEVELAAVEVLCGRIMPAADEHPARWSSSTETAWSPAG
jgi:hypothetical protein